MNIYLIKSFKEGIRSSNHFQNLVVGLFFERVLMKVVDKIWMGIYTLPRGGEGVRG